MAKKEEETEAGPRNFGVFLNNVDNGDAVIALSAEQHKLMSVLAAEAERVQGTVKGSLTLKLDFKVEHNGVVGVNYSIARKEPAPARGGSLFFMKDNNLVVENPRQTAIDFLCVPRPPKKPGGRLKRGLCFLVDDAPRFVERVAWWERVKPGAGFALLEVWSG